jgi:predicted amidohydrolase
MRLGCEGEWYARNDSGFSVAEILGIRIGVLLCTEAMFNERARAYGREKVSLIVIPRASGADIDSWKLLALTDATHPVQVFELDSPVVEAAQREYPCYVPER